MGGYGYAYDRAGFVCMAGPQPGLVALRSGVLEVAPSLTDLGIFNCRTPRGVDPGAGVRLSVHAEGRAWDAGARGVLGTSLAMLLVGNALELGVQRVIWQSHSWDSLERRWVPYSGADPHDTHVHVELCWAAARGLTLEAVRRILRPADDDQEDDEMAAPRVLWYQDPADAARAHAYRVEAGHGKYLGPVALATCRFAGLDEPGPGAPGSPAAALGAGWRGSVILVDGPCRNQP